MIDVANSTLPPTIPNWDYPPVARTQSGNSDAIILGETAGKLSPYVPGKQPQVADLVKLNTNENPYGPSPRALDAMRAASADSLRLYPDPEASDLRDALAAHHDVKPGHVFVENGSDEVPAHAFVALLKHPKPLLIPNINYSFYPV